MQYPGENLHGDLVAAEEMLESLPELPSLEALRAFIRFLQETPLLQLREEYTRIFDMSPATCLNLTYHRWGDGKERGSGMAQLNRIYGEAGYEPLGSELPDYLPRMLEFLSVCPERARSLIVREYGSSVDGLASRLGETESGYSALRKILADAFAL
jgi:nitrate reductase delta subunit